MNMDPRAAVVDPTKVLDRVLVSEGCWLWTGTINPSGYGQLSMRVDGRSTTIQAHRVVYELFVGPVPAGLEIDHLCRVRDCVRLDHLEAVTHAVNVRRGVAPQRTIAKYAGQTHCKHDHPLDGDNLYRFVDANGYQHRQCITCRDRAKARYEDRRLRERVERVRRILQDAA